MDFIKIIWIDLEWFEAGIVKAPLIHHQYSSAALGSIVILRRGHEFKVREIDLAVHYEQLFCDK